MPGSTVSAFGIPNISDWPNPGTALSPIAVVITKTHFLAKETKPCATNDVQAKTSPKV
jgi:hypothetical protein